MTGRKTKPDGKKRGYFTTIPNIVDDMELSPYAYRLYGRIRRRAGEDGVCYENTTNLAKGCCMSAGSVSKAKKELVQRGLINISEGKREGGRYYHLITIVDIWDQNTQKYCTRSQSEPIHSPGEIMGSQGERKNIPINNQPIQEGQAPSSGAPLLDEVSKNHETSSRQNSLPQLRDHPAILAMKQVTGYFPPKTLFQRIIDAVGDEPDILRMQKTFDSWVANGSNPKNYKGWLFDWYMEKMYYVPDQNKFSE